MQAWREASVERVVRIGGADGRGERALQVGVDQTDRRRERALQVRVDDADRRRERALHSAWDAVEEEQGYVATHCGSFGVPSPPRSPRAITTMAAHRPGEDDLSDFAGALEYIARSRAQNFAYVSQGCSAQQPLCLILMSGSSF